MIEEGGLENSFKELLMKDHEDISKYKSFAEFINNKKE